MKDSKIIKKASKKVLLAEIEKYASELNIVVNLISLGRTNIDNIKLFRDLLLSKLKTRIS